MCLKQPIIAMKTKDFTFPLKQQNIVQHPHLRGKSKLLVLLRSSHKEIGHRSFEDILGYLNEGDVIVLNNSKVIPTRLWSTLVSGGQREVTLIQRVKENTWTAYIRPEMDIKLNSYLHFNNSKVRAKVMAKSPFGIWHLKFFLDKSRLIQFLYKNAEINLPFYLRYSLKNSERYQTVYARYNGSCQPPTAGLHFTSSILKKIKRRGIRICYITLHISGSILPLVFSNLESIRIGKEWFSIPEKTAKNINRAKAEGKRIVAVGTTVMRALESAVDDKGNIGAGSDWTNLTIFPGFKFKAVSGFLTNFHMPCSSHLLLTCAFGGRKRIMSAYRQALAKEYDFLDFGDAMLII